MASQFCALCQAFPVEKPFRAAIALPWHWRQTLIFRRNLQGCHGLLGVKWASAVPKTGSAIDHLVTALSLKKALTMRRGFCALFSSAPRPSNEGDASRTHSGKMRNRGPLAHCAGDIVKE
jgi:hypothetical protein